VVVSKITGYWSDNMSAIFGRVETASFYQCCVLSSSETHRT